MMDSKIQSGNTETFHIHNHAGAMERDSSRLLSQSKSGLRKKLFRSVSLQLAIVLGAVFLIVMSLELLRIHRDFHRTQEKIAKVIVLNGSRLAQRTAMSLASLVNNAPYTTIFQIMSTTVATDPDILYGIYMDADRKPLVSVRPGDTLSSFSPLVAPLEDAMSLWVSGITKVQFRSVRDNGVSVIEFAAPVEKNGTILGFVRFGISVESMNLDLHESRVAWRKTKELTFSLFLLLAFSALIMALWSSSELSERITKPIRALTGSAIRIANGDYRAEIQSSGEDEIAALAVAFETMRTRIHGYTSELQSMVDQRVKQVRDILNNVRQGLFTFNLDLTVNSDCSSSALEILGFEDLTGRTLSQVFRMGSHDESLFRDWIEVVLKNHQVLRWEKLAKLAPCQDFLLPRASGERQVRVAYQKIVDAGGGLICIMALIEDVTEARLLKTRIEDEKILLEKKVETILGITCNPPEVIVEFLKDSATRINSLLQKFGNMDYPFVDKRRKKRVNDDTDSKVWIRTAYKDCHTIKGNAGAFGFGTLMELAHELENRLDEIIRGKATWSESFPLVRKLIGEMHEECQRMREIHSMLIGNSEEAYVRVPESKLLKIRHLAEKSQSLALSPDLLTLVEYCKRVSYRGLLSLTRKYQDLVARTAAKTGKDVVFSVAPQDLELDPELLFRADEALIHLLRNAVVHGIEENRSAAFLKKGIGRVDLAYSRTYGGHEFSVRDNGQGIDPDALLERAVASGILSPEAAMTLGEKDKLQLIFYPGFTTSEKPDSLSGRGMGLSIARESIAAFGGSLTLETRIGEGTVFTISLPV